MTALEIVNFRSSFGSSLSGFHVSMFILGSFAVILILLFFYNKIPKSTSSKDELNSPIYQSTDILLQSNSLEGNFLIVEKTTSIWVKAVVFILITIVTYNPFQELLGISLY